MKQKQIIINLGISAVALSTWLITADTAAARQYHVSPRGSDSNKGSHRKMLKTISAAADKAQPGDTITVHEGVYRERINPPRGGISDAKRITYQAARGEIVTIKGSEIIKGWKKIENDSWQVVIPNNFFGKFNPYRDLIHGDWFSGKHRQHHTGAVYLNGHWLIEAAKKEQALKPAGKTAMWFATVDKSNTTITAQFKGVDPNKSTVEINVRQTVFYPEKSGINYITVRGFIMKDAATPWAPPTAEQIGLIGTHWSKGWIIENNDISYSKCAGVALGKHGDEFDNTSANAAAGYVKTIERAIKHGWSKENIGHHIVRNNHIHDCEQTGVVGSLGAVFSHIYGNEIYNIHILRLFTGSEMGGIKIHAAIDTEISDNHIYRCNRGIWLDWMAQGTRVTRNLMHDNGPLEDLYVEVNHGPFLIDNNFFLSARSLKDVSEGGAYVHNLFTGNIYFHPDNRRKTPYHKANTTEIGGIVKGKGGDDRFYNNIFSGKAHLNSYDRAVNMQMDVNIFINGAKPSKLETNPTVKSTLNPGIKLTKTSDGVYLDINLEQALSDNKKRKLVNTELLGRAITPNLPYTAADGTAITLKRDYYSKKRNLKNPAPGPLKASTANNRKLKVWPKN